MEKPIRSPECKAVIASISINFLSLVPWQSVLSGAIESAVVYLLGHSVPIAYPSRSSVGTLIWSLGCQILLDLLYLDWKSCSSLCSMVWSDPHNPVSASPVCVSLSLYWSAYLCVSWTVCQCLSLCISQIFLSHPSTLCPLTPNV